MKKHQAYGEAFCVLEDMIQRVAVGEITSKTLAAKMKKSEPIVKEDEPPADSKTADAPISKEEEELKLKKESWKRSHLLNALSPIENLEEYNTKYAEHYNR